MIGGGPVASVCRDDERSAFAYPPAVQQLGEAGTLQDGLSERYGGPEYRRRGGEGGDYTPHVDGRGKAVKAYDVVHIRVARRSGSRDARAGLKPDPTPRLMPTCPRDGDILKGRFVVGRFANRPYTSEGLRIDSSLRCFSGPVSVVGLCVLFEEALGQFQGVASERRGELCAVYHDLEHRRPA